VASEEVMKKMIHAIMDKRKKLGLPDWGQVPIEDVLQRLNKTSEQDDAKTDSCEDKETDAS
jgi:hypothetical protein